MKDIILYGAGKRGEHYAKVLYEHGIEIAGFCDSYKEGNIMLNTGWKKPIFDLKDIDSSKYNIIIAIADSDQFEEVCKKVAEYQINIITLEQGVFQGKSSIEANREYIAEYHIDKMNSYFELAEEDKSMDIFWGGIVFLKNCFNS